MGLLSANEWDSDSSSFFLDISLLLSNTDVVVSVLSLYILLFYYYLLETWFFPMRARKGWIGMGKEGVRNGEM